MGLLTYSKPIPLATLEAMSLLRFALDPTTNDLTPSHLRFLRYQADLVSNLIQFHLTNNEDPQHDKIPPIIPNL